MSLSATPLAGQYQANRQLRARIKAALNEAFSQTKDELVTHIQGLIIPSNPLKPQGKIPKVTGGLSGNFYAVFQVTNATYKFTLGFAKDYAKDVDEGQMPGNKPDLEDIKEWCRRVGIPPSYAPMIVAKIKERGTTGYHFWEPIKKYVKQRLTFNIREAFRDARIPVRISV